ncbi:hypothetical protein DKM44_10690 [Deinococcus irradiatisoli]|uniref:HD-GYP domain-containing protein n=1 Tax=Deinococcus irradiatisoli TaxID=2202254 RepID=A0A2Z3JL60_9DEIO|nr:HD domain-containing phosphohydrolase [Deinococcus irradiatisoli]AWN23639.1 hypothetical protein DKM44_10690 [Deinococcus irradiatisoli]
MLSRQLLVWRGSRLAARRGAGFVREGHPQRVRDLALALGRAAGLGAAELAALEQAALLHDLGRCLLPPHADEKLHPQVGAELLLGQDLPPSTLAAVRHHHERWDGRGYPGGLRGEAIPPLARVLAVANLADHLAGFPPEVRAQRLAWERGLALDPQWVNLYLSVLGH